MEAVSYKPTILACYIGNFAQAIVINFTPIIFIPLREQYGFSYTQFGLLIFLNFTTQVLADIAFSKAVDRHGFRPFVVSAHALCAVGLALFAAVPVLFPGIEFVGFVIATIVFSCAGGLLELLLSPIIDAIPGDQKARAMALMHSFYAWGQVTVVVVTTLYIFLFGGRSWPAIALLWAIVPLVNTFLFARAPLAQKDHELGLMRIRELLLNPVFILAFFAIAFGGASEITMSQWSSSFMEKGMALPKIVGDMLGMCGFGFMLGTGRLLYGMYGEKISVNSVMIVGSLVAVVCYIAVALSPATWLSLLACALTGICVSLLWPGTLVVASAKLPLAGASMFALLAAGGDIGASVGPWLTGVVTDYITAVSAQGWAQNLAMTPEQLGLRGGILLGALYPLSALIIHVMLRRQQSEEVSTEGDKVDAAAVEVRP